MRMLRLYATKAPVTISRVTDSIAECGMRIETASALTIRDQLSALMILKPDFGARR